MSRMSTTGGIGTQAGVEARNVPRPALAARTAASTPRSVRHA